jgi:hypothetical protein
MTPELLAAAIQDLQRIAAQLERAATLLRSAADERLRPWPAPPPAKPIVSELFRRELEEADQRPVRRPRT